MGDSRLARPSGKQADFVRLVEAKAARKLRAHRRTQQGVWSGLGMFGLIGWSVAVPAVLGALLGLGWDRRHPGAHSWTLALLVFGLSLGCFNAWHWVVRENEAMAEEREERDG